MRIGPSRLPYYRLCVETDVSDHFQIFFIDSYTDITSYPQKTIFKNRIQRNIPKADTCGTKTFVRFGEVVL